MSDRSNSVHSLNSGTRQLAALRVALFILLTPVLTSCGGGDKVKTFFTKNIQPQLSTCRTCHVRGGIADIPGGRLFMLSSSSSQDYTNFKNAWSALGGGVQTNPILVKNSDFKAAHTGGVNWPVGSKTYNDVVKVFQCWRDPKSCGLTATSSRASSVAAKVAALETELPLLELGQKQSPLSAGCDGKPDNAPMPVDPRTLVLAGINKANTAVQFNGFWEDLHTPAAPFRQSKYQGAKTCGEWRTMVAAGKDYLMHESGFFSGANFFTTSVYNELWKSWGLTSRPANYDDEIVRRYGLSHAEFHNPYPLEGEDPNLTNGGSGQLPLGMLLVKDPNTNKYTGEITISCSSCHDSRLGPDFFWGRSANTFDAGLLLSDVAKRSSNAPAAFPLFPAGTGAGIAGIPSLIEPLLGNLEPGTLDIYANKKIFPWHATAGQVKTPNGWTKGFQTRSWYGALSGDHVRSSAIFSNPNQMETDQQRLATEAKFENVHAFLNSLAPPLYPYLDKIDVQLAEKGAVLFHKRDLWADGANAEIPKQPGNGSCASCHGVYSPRYAADASMLPDPRLKGIAGIITPLPTIRTDATLARKLRPQSIQNAWAASWWGYNDLNPNWTSNEKTAFSKKLTGPGVFTLTTGYSAPSLYGVWAAAPYFHNGSVPSIWGVLKPEDRPKIWRYALQEPIAPGLNAAIDSSFAAYDFDHLGYKFSELPCKKSATGFSCSPTSTAANALSTNTLPQVKKQRQDYQTMPPFNEADLEARRVINTYEYSRGNGGHDFTQALSDQERYAIIEYLKTL